MHALRLVDLPPTARHLNMAELPFQFAGACFFVSSSVPHLFCVCHTVCTTLPRQCARIVDQKTGVPYNIFVLVCTTPDRWEADWPLLQLRAIADVLYGYSRASKGTISNRFWRQRIALALRSFQAPDRLRNLYSALTCPPVSALIKSSQSFTLLKLYDTIKSIAQTVRYGTVHWTSSCPLGPKISSQDQGCAGSTGNEGYLCFMPARWYIMCPLASSTSPAPRTSSITSSTP